MKAQASEVSRRRRLRAPRGQAMVEYSMISHLLMIGGGTTMLFLSKELFNKLSLYFDGIYYVLQSSCV